MQAVLASMAVRAAQGGAARPPTAAQQAAQQAAQKLAEEQRRAEVRAEGHRTLDTESAIPEFHSRFFANTCMLWVPHISRTQRTQHTAESRAASAGGGRRNRGRGECGHVRRLRARQSAHRHAASRPGAQLFYSAGRG